MLYPWLIPTYNRFKLALRQGRLPSSLILAGQANLGIEELVLGMARMYLCQHKKYEYEELVQDNCKSCLLFNNRDGSHPDIMFLTTAKNSGQDKDFADLANTFENLQADLSDSDEEMKGNIRVESVRSLISWIYEGSVLGNGKVAVVSKGQCLSESSANALLKTFEEPAADTLMIILTEKFEDLPATLLSRAFKMEVLCQDFSQIENFLKTHLKDNYDEKRAKVALVLSRNSPLKALEYLNAGYDEDVMSFLQTLEKELFDKASFCNSLLGLLKKFTPLMQRYILEELLLELIKYKARVAQSELPFLSSLDLKKLATIPSEKLFFAYQELQSMFSYEKGLKVAAPDALLLTWLTSLRN
jgi:DNA polymerase III delta prime subunit